MLYLKSSSLLSCAILLAITADVVRSKYIYQHKFHRKIAQHKELATWKEAKALCQSEGAMLASPISKEILQYMRAIIAANNHTTPYFIGFQARHNTEFSSEEGVLLKDVPEAFDMVETMDAVNGDCLCMDRHSIRIESCWSRLPFICYSNKTSVDALTDIPAIVPKRQRLQCGPDYKLYSTGCYKLHQKEVNWTSAYWKCAAEDAYLAVINDSDEAKVVAGIIKGSGLNEGWVGLRDVTRNQDWVAITGEQLDEVFHVWAMSAAHSSSYPCAGLKSSGELDDHSCDFKRPVICEK